MEVTAVGEGEGRSLFTPTPQADQFWRGVRLARRLTRLTAPVSLPTRIRLPADRPVIVAANHSSMIDLASSLITIGHFGISARMGVATRYFATPGLGRFLAGIGCIPFAKAEAATAESTMIEALRDGQLCCLMPEGRIVRADQRVDGYVGQGRPGISRIAQAAGAAILPVGFVGADQAWPPGRAFPRPRRVPIRAVIGEPFTFDGDDHVANVEQLMNRIAALVADASVGSGGAVLRGI